MYTGRTKLRFKIIKVKAENQRNSRARLAEAIAEFFNAGIDCLGLKLVVHVLIRASLN